MKLIKTVSSESIDLIEQSMSPLKTAVVAGVSFVALGAVTLKNLIKPTAIESEYDCAEAIHDCEKKLKKAKVTVSAQTKKNVEYLNTF